MATPTSLSLRALTLHVMDLSPRILEETISSFVEKAEEVKRSFAIDTLRVVTPSTTPYQMREHAALLQRYADDYDIDIFAVPLNYLETPQNIVEAFSENPGLYTSIPYVDGSERKIYSLLLALSEESWLYPTRFAVAFGERYNTPYFPVTETRSEGVTASLLYTRLYSDHVDNLAEIKEALYSVAKLLGSIYSDFQGIDYSLSPWMEESVAAVVERKAGIQFTLPGTISAIRAINSELEDISRNAGIGYNEIMLPLGEDNRLKELARAGQLRFSHLLSYTAFCVVGLDMVPIPDTTDIEVVAGVIRDLKSIYLLKGRSLGMRLIPVGVEEGMDVDLGIFGATPVLSPLF